MGLDFLGSITGIFAIVYDGQHGLRFRLGRARAVVGPGLHFKIPLLERYVIEDTKDTTLDLEPQVIQLSDDLVYEVECKLMYQIVDLRRAVIQIDDLVTGLQNFVVMSVQRVVRAQDRESVKDTAAMAEAVRGELHQMEEHWGVRILQFGFSNISPSPASLEITQLELLARERRALHTELRDAGLTDEAAVALVTGAVVTTHPEAAPPARGARRREEAALAERAAELAEEERDAARRRERPDLAKPEEGGEEQPGGTEPA
jgi:regulator of protease activity HflC (stomatin/prohibitin superfamily)